MLCLRERSAFGRSWNNLNTKNNAKTKLPEDVAANRLSLFVTLSFVAVIGLVFLYRAVDSVQYLSFFSRSVTVLIWVSAALVALSVWRMAASRGKDVSEMVLTPGTGLFLSVVALLSGLFLRLFYNDAIKLLYMLIPGLCVVYLIKLIYGNGFYPVSGFLLASATALYVFDRFLLWGVFETWRTAFGLLLVLFGIVFVALCLRCKKNDGALRLAGRDIALFKKTDSYIPAYLSSLAVLAVGGVFVKSPSHAMFYGLMGLGALAVVLAMYYTYRLMYH